LLLAITQTAAHLKHQPKSINLKAYNLLLIAYRLSLIAYCL